MSRYTGYTPGSSEEIKHQYEELKAQNLYKMQSALTNFDTDENGQTTYLGMPVSKEMQFALETTVNSLKPYVVSYSDKISDVVAKGARSIPFLAAHSNKVGWLAENTFRWGVVGAEQIFGLVKTSNKYAKDRKDLFVKLAPVMQATGANLQNNEVIKIAYDEVHQDWISGLKKLVADIPAMIPVIYSAVLDHNSHTGKKKVEAKDSVGGTVVSENAELLRQRMRLRQKFDEDLKAEIQTIKSEFKGDKNQLKEYIDEFVQNANEDFRHRANSQSRDEQFQHEAPAQDRNTAFLIGAGTLGSIISQGWKGSISTADDKRNQQVKAWKLIEHLKVEMESHCDDRRGRRGEYDDCDKSFTSRSVEEITISGKGNREGEMVNLKEYIIEVFQQHERDREPDRNFYDKKTGRAIDPLRGVMLTNLMPAVEIIAEHIADGSLSGDALYKLVGENRVIKHSPSGARTFAKEAEVRKLIDEELSPVLGTREVIKMEEFISKFADPALIKETLKNNLAAMHGLEKSLFASLFPDDILVQAGMKKKEILAARKEAHEHAYDFVSAVVMHFSKKTDEELTKLGVTEAEGKAIRSLVENVEKGDLKSIKLAVDGRNKEVLDAVRTAGLLEQVQQSDKKGGFWTDRVKQMGEMHATIKKNSEVAKAEAESGSKSDFGGEEREGEWSKRSADRYGSDKDSDSRDSWNKEDSSRAGYSDRFEKAGSKGFSSRERMSKERDSGRDDFGDYRS